MTLLREVGPDRWKRRLSGGVRLHGVFISFPGAVSHVNRLLVWMCVVSRGLHQDPHRVAAKP